MGHNPVIRSLANTFYNQGEHQYSNPLRPQGSLSEDRKKVARMLEANPTIVIDSVAINDPSKLLAKATLIIKLFKNCTPQVRKLAFFEILHGNAFTDLSDKSKNCEYKDVDSNLESVKISSDKADAVDVSSAILSSLIPFVSFLEAIKTKFKAIDLTKIATSISQLAAVLSELLDRGEVSDLYPRLPPDILTNKDALKLAAHQDSCQAGGQLMDAMKSSNL
jgi:hypothetical protein